MDGTTQSESPVAADLDTAHDGQAITTRGAIQAVRSDGVGQTIDIMQIMSAIPHRYPFLMIDRMVEVVLGESAIGVKNVTINEPFFTGHFPSKPVMPGVLVIEAMAQTAAALVVLSLDGDWQGKLVYFMTIDSAKFRRPVGPGDQLRIHVNKERSRGNVYKFRGVARVDGVSVAEANYSAMIMG